jgi:hypothetical protein
VSGRAAETLDNALLRGPLEMRRLERVVTADDYEMVAVRSSGAVTRAKAFAQASLWKHASPGTVEVLLVPEVSSEARGMGPLTAAKLEAHQTEAAQTQVQRILNQRRPLGTACLVNWARYKTVRVKARIVGSSGGRPRRGQSARPGTSVGADQPAAHATSRRGMALRPPSPRLPGLRGRAGRAGRQPRRGR